MLTITPLPAALGATVEGIDLADQLDGPTAERLRAALLDHQVLFFPDQPLTPSEQMRFGSSFGQLERHPALASLEEAPEVVVFDTADGANTADLWHSDVTCAERPPMGAILQMVIAPEKGGATHWANTAAAYDALDDDVKQRIDGMRALHRSWWEPKEERLHPVVRTHPETGRKALFVNRLFTIAIDGLAHDDSEELLTMLCDQSTRDEFTVRHDWSSGDIAFWDNRCTLHRVDDDFGGQRRRGHRVVIDGDEPR